MDYEILEKPDFSMVKVTFAEEGEQVVLESSAMVAMSPELTMKTGLAGGLWKAAKRKLASESGFQNTFTATEKGQTLYFAPGPEGDVEVHECGQSPLLLSSGAFLGSAVGVQLDTKWEGARGFFAGSGLFLLRAHGEGPLFFSCYGGLHRVDVGEGGYVCDTSHVVAFTPELDYSVESVGGAKSLLFSGEGLVCRFVGEGTLWLSTRNPGALASFVHPFRSVTN